MSNPSAPTRRVFPFLRAPADLVWHYFGHGRKDASTVNQEFLDWLSQRHEPGRPFFAFLNFYDAHYPYDLPAMGLHRFSAVARNERERAVLRDWIEIQKNRPTERQIGFARDSYDDCLADLDERLGELFDELERRAILEQTCVIITGDHGESFGEHPGVFVHGTTLYQTERHVPLVIIPPGGAKVPNVVAEPVSLRDMAATIADLAGLKADLSFPGVSLARFWSRSPEAAPSELVGRSPALSELAPERPLGVSSPGVEYRLWPMAALVDGDWSYVRRDGDRLELLFNLRTDAGELHNLASDPAFRPLSKTCVLPSAE